MDMERREMLKWLGIGGAGASATVVGASAVGRNRGGETADGNRTPEDRKRTPAGTATTTPTATATGPAPTVRHAAEFGTVVDAVDAGVDPDGDEPINEFIEANAGDDTLLSFREGRYPIRPLDLTGYTQFGIAAARSGRPTFAATDGNCVGGGKSYVRFDGVEDLLLDAVRFDFGADAAGGAIRINAAGDATVADVSVTGACDEQVTLFRIDILDPDATGLVRNFRLSNDRDDLTTTGVYVGEPHAGTVVFRDCEISGFTDNGLYASAPGLEDGERGTVHVEGGTYRNNNISNVRLGSEGSVARDVTSVSDARPPTAADSPPANARGFRLRSGWGQLIDGCVVRITEDSRFTHGGIVFHPTNGGATVQETSLEIDRNETPAIKAFPRDSDHGGTPEFEGLEVTGDAAAGSTVVLAGRDGSVFRNCRITQTGRERNGIYLRNCEGCRVVDSHIDVTRNPLILRGSSAVVENTTLVTPDGTVEVDRMEATDGDFTPGGEK